MCSSDLFSPRPSTTDGAPPRPARPEPTEAETKQYDERTLGSFIYDGCTETENLRRWRIPHQVIREGEWGSEYYLIGPKQTSYFAFSRIDVNGSVPLLDAQCPRVGMVLDGSGSIKYDAGEFALRKGDELFLPHSIPNAALTGNLSLVLCYPEGAPDLTSIASA